MAKSNQHLVDYVSIPGYANAFRNRDQIRGSGVSWYIRENINFKHRQKFEKLQPDMGYSIWIEIPGRNNNSKLLLGVTYRSKQIQQRQAWLESFETMLVHISAHWDGLLVITGDVKINMLKPVAALTKQYTDILSMYNLQQVVTKPTRITPKSKTLIYHFITNYANRCDTHRFATVPTDK